MSDGITETIQATVAKLQAERDGHLTAVEALDNVISQLESLAGGSAAPKRRGRPKGSKNKSKAEAAPSAEPKKRGRPKGSKNKSKAEAASSNGAAAKPSKSAKMDSNTPIADAGLPPRVVKLCEDKEVSTIGELSEHYIPDLVKGVDRIGVGAITAMEEAIRRAGLKPVSSPSGDEASTEA